MAARVTLWFILLGIVYLCFSIWLTRRRVRYLKHEIREEQIRTLWAESRNTMFELVRDGKLSQRSATFREFYRLQTFILRRPDDYPRISALAARAMLHPSPGHDPEWFGEKETWPEEMQEVVEGMTAGIAYLAWGSSGFRRAVYLWMFRTVKALAVDRTRRLYEALVAIINKIPGLRDEWKLIEVFNCLNQVNARLHGSLAYAA